MTTTSTPLLFLFLFVLQKLSSLSAAGDNLSTYGSRFYFGFLRQALETGEIDIIVHSRHDESVTFSITSLDTYSHFGTTSLNNPITLNIPTAFQVRDSNYEYRNLGLYIETFDSKEITVKALGYTNNLSPRMTYLVHPYTVLYTSEYIYYAMSANDTSGNYFSQILIVGNNDNTTVSLRPTQNISIPEDVQNSSSLFINVPSGSFYTFVINEMQTVLITSDNNDLTGTKIIANNPLSVISGHDCAKVPYTMQTSDCDPLATQIAPTANWDTLFLLPPLNGRTNGQKYKIIASENDTNITLKCGNIDVIRTVLQTDGDVYDIDIISNDYCLLVTDKPCYVGEYGFNRVYYGDTIGDPLLITIPPVSQYIHNVTFTAFTTVNKNYFSILIPNDEQLSFTFVYNGNELTPTWTPISYPNGSIAGYGYSATFSGTVTISHINPNGLLCITVYGYTTIGGYGYLAGRALKLVNADFDPAEVSFTASFYSVNEDGGEIIISMDRTVMIAIPVQVRVTSHTWTSQGDSDYVSFENIVTFSSEETIKNITVTIIDDDLVEGIEYLILSMEAVSDYTIITNNDITVITINDNDVLQVGFSSSPMAISNSNNTVADFFVSIISGRLQHGLRVGIELKVGSNTTDDDELLCVLYFNEAITEHSLKTVFNNNNQSLQWSNLFLASAHNESDIHITVSPSEATLIHTIPPLNSQQVTQTSTIYTLLDMITSDHVSSTSSSIPLRISEPISSTHQPVLSGVPSILISSTLQVSSAEISLSKIFENIIIAVASLFVILFTISCIANIAFCSRYFILRKRSKINQMLSIDQDVKLYSNGVYGGASATVLDFNQRSLPRLPDYDDLKVYEELENIH